MSIHGPFQSPGADDWVEEIRDVLKQEPSPPPLDDAIFEAAYDAIEIDTVMMFDYFEGRLSEEERLEVEAEVAASPHAMKKLARIGAIVAQSQEIETPAIPIAAATKPQSPPQQFLTSTTTASSPKPTRKTHRVRLSQPQPALGLNAQPRSEDCVQFTTHPDCECYRSLEKNRDQLRLYHQSAPIGTLIGIRFTTAASIWEPPDLFVVLRRGSESSTMATFTIPLSFKRREIDLELLEIPLADFTIKDAACVLSSYENAAQEDPVSITPLHEPRSAWQTWADGVLQTPAEEVPTSIREIAELIAAS